MILRNSRTLILTIIISAVSSSGSFARLDNKSSKVDASKKQYANQSMPTKAPKNRPVFSIRNWNVVTRIGHRLGYVQEVHVGCENNSTFQKFFGIVNYSLFDRSYCTPTNICYSSLQAAASSICDSNLQRSTLKSSTE